MTWFANLLYAFSLWLKSTHLTELAVWISNQPWSITINQNTLITPTLQSIHILAIAATFSAALMIQLRVAGLAGQGRTLAEIEKRYTPWFWWGLLTLLATGAVLIAAEPARELLHPAFWIKMVLILGMMATVLWFQKSVRTDPGFWNEGRDGYRALKTGAIALLLVWALIMICGRWIAYGV